MARLFEDLSHNEQYPLEEVADVRAGQARSPKRRNGVNPTPYLRVENIKDGEISFDDVLETDFSPDETHKYGLMPGDYLLIGENANPNYIGTLPVYNSQLYFCKSPTLDF